MLLEQLNVWFKAKSNPRQKANRNRIWLLVGCFWLLTTSSLAQVFGPQPNVAFATIAQGEISHFRYSTPTFGGADIWIKDQKSWESFWQQHITGTSPVTKPPEIDFSQEMVLVTVMGIQSSGGGPAIKIAEITYNNADKSLRVMIEDTETPGMLTVITSPFHIVKLKNLKVKSITFEHKQVKSSATHEN